MRILRFLLVLSLTAALMWMLAFPHEFGGKSLPLLGDFFNPYTGFWQNAEPAQLNSSEESLELPGLHGPATLVYDDLQVPHIWAASLEDAMRVQGYVVAKHRLWQMDMLTRRAGGRLSEVLGDRTLAVDRLNRRRGMVYAAEKAVDTWKNDPDTTHFHILKAYTEGVNAYIEQLDPADYPVEFKVLNYAPEPWTELKTALMLKNMAENLSSRENDLASTNTLAWLGRDTFHLLFPEWNPKQQPIVPDTGQWKNIQPYGQSTKDLPPPHRPKPAALGLRDAPAQESYEFGLASSDFGLLTSDYGIGSNNWAVNGIRTQDGSPLLANDPHLGLNLPCIWYLVHFHTPEMNAMGVTFPGIPGIILGFNKEIAWGVTNVSHDVSDWYRVQWADAGRTTYLLDSMPKPVEYRVEAIGIKGQPTLYDTVRYTVWGPVMYDHEPDNPLRDCALRWLAHEPPVPGMITTFIRLGMGDNYQDYKDAVHHYDNPAQNMVFAARSGDIAIEVQGRYPYRAPQQGRFIQDGSRTANAWQGYIPWEHIPGMHNPSRGYVFSANQHSTPPSYPYYYLGDFDDYRGRRIHDRLEALRGAVPDSMKAMQLDNFSQRAADALPLLLSMVDPGALDPIGRTILENLKSWRYTYDATLTAPSYYEIWYDSLYAHTWDEFYQQKKAVLFPEPWRLISLLETDPNNIFFDDTRTGARETARDIVRNAFNDVVAYRKANPDKVMEWGQFRPVQIRHLARIDAFSRLNLPLGGHPTAPNAQGVAHGPSWRLIAEPGPTMKAWGVYPGGQSGNPGSPFYDNLLDVWAKGEYFQLELPTEAGSIQGEHIQIVHIKPTQH